MRVIKFRVWDTEFKRMLFYGPLFSLFGGSLDFHTTEVNQTCHPVVHHLSFDNMASLHKYVEGRFLIQQGTGIRDINGKDIYEGDIVKTVKSKCIKIVLGGEAEYTAGVITWLREAFCLCQSGVGGNEMSHYVDCDCCNSGLEIVGNIFENPELCAK